MEIALYARVSTNHQMQTQSIEQQLVRLQEAVSENPEWQLKDEHVYRDDGFTGAKLNRPGLDRLRDAASIPTQFVRHSAAQYRANWVGIDHRVS